MDSKVYNLKTIKNNFYLYNLFTPPKPNSFVQDSGTTNYFGTTHQLNDSQVPCSSITASLPSNKII